eukprot:TRINITY_DN52078_c0_g1_i1.p1 TRINITY_DN52078_c0_g1~~TRINITY_DN52078_c0_g1_i1.p1  ORF type:complete len:103 (-),score=3.75 TRINITY_DN52078_c0_g1_i1:67-375(-)
MPFSPKEHKTCSAAMRAKLHKHTISTFCTEFGPIAATFVMFRTNESTAIPNPTLGESLYVGTVRCTTRGEFKEVSRNAHSVFDEERCTRNLALIARTRGGLR